jgi:HicB-like protein involved in pilus formation
MQREDKRRLAFPLRLAASLRESAVLLANKDGISLNHFISLAVAEKISRLENEPLSHLNARGRQRKLPFDATVKPS